MTRLAFSARATVKVGLLDCEALVTADGYTELEPFCQELGVTDVPTLVAYRRGTRDVQQGEVIPLFAGEQEDHDLATPMIALRAMEVVLRLSAPMETQLESDVSDFDSGQSDTYEPSEDAPPPFDDI